MYTLIAEIWSTTRRNKLRTALTGFAVAWGIFMLICLLGAGNGLINAATQNMDRFLSTSMMVGGGSTSKEYNGLPKDRPITLNDQDINTTQNQFKQNVETVGAEIELGNQTITLGDNYETASLMGVYPNEIEINKRKMLCGRFINQTDMEEQRKVLVISKSRAEGLMPNNWQGVVGLSSWWVSIRMMRACSATTRTPPSPPCAPYIIRATKRKTSSLALRD